MRETCASDRLERENPNRKPAAEAADFQGTRLPLDGRLSASHPPGKAGQPQAIPSTILFSVALGRIAADASFESGW